MSERNGHEVQVTLLIRNPHSKRENPFRAVYDNTDFVSVLEDKDKLPRFPFLVDIELTNHCNLGCVMCARHVMKRDKGFMSEEIFMKVVDECAEHSTPVRFIRYGEPFLHTNILEFCEYAKSRGLLVHITTNGLAVTERHMQSLVGLAVDSVIFSFQGTTKERYECIRNNGVYDKLRDTIERLVHVRGDRDKPFIHVSTTVLDDSQAEVDRFVEHWVHLVDSVGVGKTKLDLISVDDLEPALGRKIRDLKKNQTLEKVYRPCTEVYQKLSVDWDGQITCCCGDFDQLLTVGNIGESTLSHVWNHGRRLAVYREMLDAQLHRSLNLCSTCYHTYEEF